MLQMPTSFIVDYKYFHANALEHGRNTNSLLGSSKLSGFVLALRMVFPIIIIIIIIIFFPLIRFFTIYREDPGLLFFYGSQLFPSYIRTEIRLAIICSERWSAADEKTLKNELPSFKSKNIFARNITLDRYVAYYRNKIPLYRYPVNVVISLVQPLC